jgi:hypothetical protein
LILVGSKQESLLHLHYELGAKKSAPLEPCSFYTRITSHLLPTRITLLENPGVRAEESGSGALPKLVLNIQYFLVSPFSYINMPKLQHLGARQSLIACLVPSVF